MDDATLQRVCSLATAFRQSAHLLLDHHHKLSLDTWTLCEIQEAFSLILEIEQHTNFHVLPPNHRQHPAIPHLQFIYDLLQKVSGLRLWAKHGHSLPESETTSLRCFRSLQALELDHVPVKSLKALQTLRPTLKSIISVKGLNQLSDLFIRCGADRAGEFVWDQLQEAVLAHNSLHVLDHSLSLLPKLKILDLSHCELEDASGLEYLPSVSVLDISHNHLRLIPRFSSTATFSLTALIANNNLFSHVEGLQNMNNIEELDLRDNVLCMQDVLAPIGALPHLRVFKVKGNPFTVNINYRLLTIKQLNPATANHHVTIDGLPLTLQEQAMVGLSAASASSIYSPELLSSLSSLSSLCSPVSFLTAPDVPSQPFIKPNYEEDPVQNPSMPEPHSSDHEPLSSSVKSTDIPNPPPPSLAVGPMFLGVNSDPIVQAITSLTCQEEIRCAFPEQSDSLLEKILQARTEAELLSAQAAPLVTSRVTHANEKPSRPSALPLNLKGEESTQENLPASHDYVEADGEEDRSMEISRDSSILEDNSKLSGHNSDITPPESESEDEKEDVQLFLAKKEISKLVKHASAFEDELLSIEESKEIQDIIIAVTPLYFKEKNGVTARTIYRWDLCCIESMELLSIAPHKVLITFDTIKPSYKKRTYILDSGDYQHFTAVLSPILEKNTLKEVLHSAMTCLKCNTQFSRDLAKQSNGSELLKCPNCGGGVVVRVERVDHPAVSEAIFDEKGLRSSTPVNQVLTQSSAMTSSDAPSYPEESSESVSVCSEASSYVRRESDVEVISNPSISSIEILNDQQIIHDVILEEDGDEPKPPPPLAAVNSDARTPANSPSTFHKPEPSTGGMQESSSSGSMTGSVCTTYEKSSSLPTSPLKNSTHHHSETDLLDSKSLLLESQHDSSSGLYKTAEATMISAAEYGTPPYSSGSPTHLFSSSSTSIDTVKHDHLAPSLHHKAVMTSVLDDTDTENIGQHSLTSWVQSLLHTLTGYGWLWWEEVDHVEGVQRIANPIRYSYEDFTDIDHRLKLHCEVLLFHEPDELLLGLVKAVLLVKGGLREFQGILVLSSKKIYILEIVGQEDDSPQTWLELQASHNLCEVSVIHSLYQRQGLGLTIGDTELLISLADSHRANCFFNFFLETIEEFGVSPSIQECSPAQEESLTSIVKEALPYTAEETSLSLFAVVSLLLDGGCSESQFLTMTNTDLILYHADLEWYMPPVPDSKLQLNTTQKIANITAIEVRSDRHLGLQFLDEATGVESSWELHVTTPVAACHIIQAIRTPWTHLFSVDLEDFLGIYRTKEGDVLSMTRMLMDEDSPDGEECQGWCQVSAVYAKLKYDPKYPILGYSDSLTNCRQQRNLNQAETASIQKCRSDDQSDPSHATLYTENISHANIILNSDLERLQGIIELNADNSVDGVSVSQSNPGPPVFKQSYNEATISFD